MLPTRGKDVEPVGTSGGGVVHVTKILPLAEAFTALPFNWAATNAFVFLLW